MIDYNDIGRIIRITEVWAVDNPEDAETLIEEKSKDCGGEISKKTVERRTKKAKGVVIDEAYKVTIQVDYNEIFPKDAFEEI